MSANLPSDKRIWIGAASVAIVAVALIWVAAVGGEGRSPIEVFGGLGKGRSEPPRTAPKIDHAPWKLRVSRAGRPERLSKQAKARLEAQRPKVKRAVRAAYDAIFLDQERPARSFTDLAWRAFQETHATLPQGSESVRLLWRRALIGLQADSARRASAQVTVVASGIQGERKFKLSHRARLWLERKEQGWKIAAFDMSRRPLKLSRGKS
ncbi:MAG TPA: hypothetical protein VFF07_12170 [Actinomycetota bacterium]|nr:hypothetical protein [Actinomycetota bacterium]